MSFWRNFGFYTVSSIETTLNKPDFTLEDLLDDDEILQEVKAQNRKLIEVLAQPGNLKSLVEYLTAEPADDTQRAQIKLPLISAEVLCSDVPAILEGLMKDATLIEQMLNYLEKPAPLHPMRSNLVCRVIGFILDKKPTEMLAMMHAKPTLMDTFLNHLGNPSVVELLQKVVGSEPTTRGAESTHSKWLEDSQLIHKLTSRMSPEFDAETHLNAANALGEMLRVPTMAKALETEEILASLLSNVLAVPNPRPLSSNTAVTSGLNVIIELLRQSASVKYEPTSEVPLEKLSITYTIIIKELDKFKAILTIGEPVEKISTTMGDIEPLGFARLKVLELIAVLSQSNYQCVDSVLMEKGMFDLVISLFFHFPWNNVLHAHVLGMIRKCLDSSNEELKEHLLKDAKLHHRIIAAEKENAEALKEPRGIRRGYMGHLIQLAAELRKQASHSPVIGSLLEADEDWKVFRDSFLKERTELEANLLGSRPTPGLDSSSAEEDDEDEEEDDDDLDTHQYMDAPDDSAFNPGASFDEKPHGSTSSDEEDDTDDEIIQGEAPPQAPPPTDS